MRGARLLAVLLVLSFGLVGQPGPASAHGSCKVTAYPPTPGLVTVVFGGEIDCVESHGHLYVYACLEHSLTPLGGWITVGCTPTAHAENAKHVDVVAMSSEQCVLGYYRSKAEGWNASLVHWNVDHSPPVACMNIKISSSPEP